MMRLFGWAWVGVGACAGVWVLVSCVLDVFDWVWLCAGVGVGG